MTGQDLLDRVAELLGFRVTERDNDAVLIREKLAGTSVSSVRPATREELAMFLRIIGLVARMEDLATENLRLQERSQAASIQVDTLQVKLDRAARDFSAAEDNFQERISSALREIEALNAKLSQLEEINRTPKSKGSSNE